MGFLPEGEGIRQALRWISDRRLEDPKAKLVDLVDEAARKYDLTPIETDFLFRALTENK